MKLGIRSRDKINRCCREVVVVEKFDKNQSMDFRRDGKKVTFVAERWMRMVEIDSYTFINLLWIEVF